MSLKNIFRLLPIKIYNEDDHHNLYLSGYVSFTVLCQICFGRDKLSKIRAFTKYNRKLETESVH